MAMQMPGSTRSEMNVTPLIDVLLVLLVVFMLNIVPRMVLTLQLARDAGADQSMTHSLVLELTNDGHYRLNTIPVPAESLQTVLRQVFAVREPRLLFVKSGSQRRYGDTIEAIDVARGAGVEIIALAQ